jgi:hypothetical protein
MFFGLLAPEIDWCVMKLMDALDLGGAATAHCGS